MKRCRIACLLFWFMYPAVAFDKLTIALAGLSYQRMGPTGAPSLGLGLM
jgi:hypothetical protein